MVKKRSGTVFHQLAKKKGCWIEEGHIMPDHVHMLINVPPKLAVSAVVGYIKGKRHPEPRGRARFQSEP